MPVKLQPSGPLESIVLTRSRLLRSSKPFQAAGKHFSETRDWFAAFAASIW